MEQQLDLLARAPGSGAELSDDGLYRYQLWRVWDQTLPRMVWVMLNPSVADALKDDATIRRCIGFAKLWGYGGITVINLFAFRSTDPDALIAAVDPVGTKNADVFGDVVVDGKPRLIVAAWGGGVPDRYKVYLETYKSTLRFHGAQCLGHTKAGEPKHPVRLAYATELRPL